MNLLRFADQVVDLEQVASHEIKSSSIVMTFHNGDSIEVTWRDALEKKQVLSGFEKAVAAIAPGSIASE